MTVTVQIEGMRELERELEQLSKSLGKAVLRRALKKSATPLADLMRDLAPRGDTASDDLAESIMVGTRLSKRQARMHRRMFRDDRASVEMFVGPGPDPAAWNQEFGNIIHGPQSFVRPAWDQDHRAMLDRLGSQLWIELEKTVLRAQRRAAKAAQVQ